MGVTVRSIVFKGAKRVVLGSAKVAFGFGAGIYIDQNYCCVRRVVGSSMSPTLNGNYHLASSYDIKSEISNYDDWVFFNRHTKDLQRGDVVFLKRPNKSDKLVKRVAAVEGDTITPETIGEKVRAPVQVGRGQVWVESDAVGPGYLGSSVFGPVNLENIEGIAVFSFGFRLGAWRLISQEIPQHIQERLVVGTADPSLEKGRQS